MIVVNERVSALPIRLGIRKLLCKHAVQRICFQKASGNTRIPEYVDNLEILNTEHPPVSPSFDVDPSPSGHPSRARALRGP